MSTDTCYVLPIAGASRAVWQLCAAASLDVNIHFCETPADLPPQFRGRHMPGSELLHSHVNCFSGIGGRRGVSIRALTPLTNMLSSRCVWIVM
jgi:hypothetical protein